MRNIEVIQGNGSYALRCPDYVDARVLAANTAESHTVPSGANYVVFSATGDFYVKYNGTASVPSSDVTDGTASELNPDTRFLGTGVTSISVIAPAITNITLSFFKG